MDDAAFVLFFAIATGFFLIGAVFFAKYTITSKTENEITKKLIYDVLMTIGFMVIGVGITIAGIGIKIFSS